MHPVDHDHLAQRRQGSIRRALRRPQAPSQGSGEASNVRRLISEESWIDISSRPSSSSLSSAGTDDAVAASLQLPANIHAHRRRLRRSVSAQTYSSRPSGPSSTGGSSSQDEYEESESESESDRIMSSSSEDVPANAIAAGTDQQQIPMIVPSSAPSGRLSLDENATALGTGTLSHLSTTFTPQPNAFSHPPASRQANSQGDDMLVDLTIPVPISRTAPAAAATSSQTRCVARPPTSPGPHPITPRAHTRRRSHTPYNMISPSHVVTVDHDAALRASLSTLLSCAAAARGLPKRDAPRSSTTTAARGGVTRPVNFIEPTTLRLVPESALDGPEAQLAPPFPRRPSQRSNSSEQGIPTPPKRKSKSPSQDRRKKHRSGTGLSNVDLAAAVSPTLMTWVVGAGVVVLVSAIGFSAGYALGKEVGRVEGMSEVGQLGGCAREVDGLGRLGRGRSWRWGNTSGVRV